jgi:hypothetical protein
MDDTSKAVLEVLIYLLPGLVSAALVYVLTPAARPVPFERLVQALLYTIVVQALLVIARGAFTLVGSHCCAIGYWTEGVALVWSVLLAVVVGLLSAWADNTDRVHALLRRAGITYQTSFPSEWFGAFSQNEGYVVLHLKGERRLYGWPEEWPSSPERGHFVVAQAEWLTPEGRTPLSGVQHILVRAEDVEMVEMMVKYEPSTEVADGRPQDSDATPQASPALGGVTIASAGSAAAAQAAAAARATAEAVSVI